MLKAIRKYRNSTTPLLLRYLHLRETEMKNIRCLTLLSCLLLVTFARSARAGIVVNFDELTGYNFATANGNYFDGHGSGATTGFWQSQGVSFNTGMFGPGWSYSNVNDTTTDGFANQWASITGQGIGNVGNYAIGYGDDAYFNIPSGNIVNSISVSNATYAALSMLNGDAFAKKFGGSSGSDPDFFRVTFTGFTSLNATGSQTGNAEFFLADYRSVNNTADYVVQNWRLLNLASLGNAVSVGIKFDGSDVGSFGLNTPAYVAIDNLTFTAVPEPSSLLLASCVSAVVLSKRQKRKRIAVEAA